MNSLIIKSVSKTKTLFVFLLLISHWTFAKKVKFAVNMAGQTISSDGVHVSGDFQAAAGFAGGDWQPGTTLLSQEGMSTIYSIIVDIPAHKKYEYYFLNGNLSYNIEFVPVESRVTYNYDSNRWIYVDSLANDTTFVGAIPYSGNAPFGYHLVRFKVGMQNETASISNVHIAGSFQAWDPSKTTMYSFDGNTYEYIAYVDTSVKTYSYKFVNGNIASDYETVPNACATSGNRLITLAKDTVLDTLCFASCSNCLSVSGISRIITPLTGFKLFPNPTSEMTTIQFNDNDKLHQITLMDVCGRVVKKYNSLNSYFQINVSDLTSGLYFVSILDNMGKTTLSKLTVK